MLDEVVAAPLFLKCENFQRTGSFKFRGAFNALSRLDATAKARGVLTYSSGNHAQALSLAGRLQGIAVTVVMPDDAPAVKVRATKSYGAEIITYSRAQTTREELAAELAKERGLPTIPPYDHPDIVAGQGTVGLELATEISSLSHLIVCCGGGGLLSGCAIAAKSLNPNIHVVGVEPEAADDAYRSFYSGQLISVRDPDTIADGARTPSLGNVTFPLVRSFVDEMALVTESEIVAAMRFLWERMKIVVEPTGALAVAAVIAGRVDVKGRRTGVVISGGNVDLAYALTLFTSEQYAVAPESSE